MTDKNKFSPELVTVPKRFSGVRLIDALKELGSLRHSPCGGKGLCGGCRVRLADGRLSDYSGNIVCADEHPVTVLACRYLCTDSDSIIELLPHRAEAAAIGENCPNIENGIVGFAADIGTTTIAVAAVDKDGKIIAEIDAENPQHIFGADVMSRITAADDGKTEIMHGLVTDALSSMTERLADRLKPAEIPKIMVAAANPTMTALLCGISPVKIGTAPFTLPFSESRRFNLGDTAIKVTTLPLSSPFIGGDALAGAALCDMDDSDEPVLFADIGTNSELLLSAGGRIYAASAAAGPALEGVGISCGVGGIPGAVCSVSRGPSFSSPKNSENLSYKTIDGKAPVGICGAGLCDLVAALLETGVLSSDGRIAGGIFTLDGEYGISVDNGDMQSFMLAKAAIRAGIECLMNESGTDAADISKLYIAGGLGGAINRFSAARVGLVPSILTPKMISVGNSSLAGAARCVADVDFFEKIERFSKKAVTITLAGSSYFADRFMKNIGFDR